MISLFDKIRFRLQDHCESGDCRKYCHECDFKTALRIVDEVEAEHGNGWIPCSERYPNKEEYLKNDGRFIVTDGHRVYQSIYDIYINHCFRTPKLFNLLSGRQWEFEIDNCVIAWMPLPFPYTPTTD